MELILTLSLTNAKSKLTDKLEGVVNAVYRYFLVPFFHMPHNALGLFKEWSDTS